MFQYVFVFVFVLDLFVLYVKYFHQIDVLDTDVGYINVLEIFFILVGIFLIVLPFLQRYSFDLQLVISILIFIQWDVEFNRLDLNRYTLLVLLVLTHIQNLIEVLVLMLSTDLLVFIRFVSLFLFLESQQMTELHNMVNEVFIEVDHDRPNIHINVLFEHLDHLDISLKHLLVIVLSNYLHKNIKFHFRRNIYHHSMFYHILNLHSIHTNQVRIDVFVGRDLCIDPFQFHFHQLIIYLVLLNSVSLKHVLSLIIIRLPL